MSTLRSTKKGRTVPKIPRDSGNLSHLGDDYLALIDANHRGSTLDRMRAERERHQATRPCIVCDVPMVDGACVEHGTPAEDRGDWLWA